jgi:YHS domain-containing protein
MTPLRLLILAALFYIAWRLFKGIGIRNRSEEKFGRPETGGSNRVEDILVEDPVCHRLVPKNQAIRLRQEGKTIYFCSDECCDNFSAAPNKGEQ